MITCDTQRTEHNCNALCSRIQNTRTHAHNYRRCCIVSVIIIYSVDVVVAVAVSKTAAPQFTSFT